MGYSLFQAPASSGVFSVTPENLEKIKAAASINGLTVLNIDAAPIADKATLLKSLGSLLAFPEWYGGNLDALHDCLIDPEWHPEPTLILFHGMKEFISSSRKDLNALLDVFRSATGIRGEENRGLWILVDSSSPGINPAPAA